MVAGMKARFGRRNGVGKWCLKRPQRQQRIRRKSGGASKGK